MEPVFMILGHSAGSAAALVIENDAAVQDIAPSALRARLLGEQQVLDRLPPTPKTNS
jgi:hypothetical protein